MSSECWEGAECRLKCEWKLESIICGKNGGGEVIGVQNNQYLSRVVFMTQDSVVDVPQSEAANL